MIAHCGIHAYQKPAAERQRINSRPLASLSSRADSSNGLTQLNLAALAPPEGTNGTLPYNDAGFENVALGETMGVEIPGGSTTGLAYHVILQLTRKTAPLPIRRYLRLVLNVEP